MTNLHDARVAAGAKALFEESQGLDQENSWDDPLPDEWREEWKQVAGEVLAAADAVVTVEMIAEVILKSLVFTDATSMAWANGVARNVLALIRGGEEQ